MPAIISVPVNQATIEQLQILLGLTADEANEVAGSRPFNTAQDFARLLPARLSHQGLTLDISKFNINSVAATDLERVAKISPELSRKIVTNRPYYLMDEIRPLLDGDIDALARIESFFGTPILSYVEKTTGTQVTLIPDPSQLLMCFKDGEEESGQDIARELKLTPMSTATKGDAYKVFSVSQVESATDSLAAAKSSPRVELVIPSFQDEGNNSIYLDPEYCVAQFKENVPIERAESLINSLLLEIYKRHRSVGLYTLRLAGGRENPAKLIHALNSLNGSLLVKFAEPAYIGVNDTESNVLREVRNHDTGTADFLESGSSAGVPPWNLRLVHAEAAWKLNTGSPDVVIAVIDTGVESQHPALVNAVLVRPPSESWNFADDNDPVPTDDEGHGTFIAGLFVGNGELGIQGVCPGCSLLPLKVPINSTTDSYARRRDAILYALDYAGTKRLVINISWKTTGNVALIHDALNLAVSRNAVVVCSAGNWPDTRDEPHYPSDYVCTISVAGVGPDGRRAPYSFFGSAVDLAAPGGNGDTSPQGNILSSAPGGTTAIDFGTSFSAPHVGGAAALLLSQNPNLSVGEIRQLIESSSEQLMDDGLGHGLLDIGAASTSLAGKLGIALGQPGSTVANGGLIAVNTLDSDTLMATFGLPRITALLLVQRRPYEQLADIQGTLGMTSEAFNRIAAYGA